MRLETLVLELMADDSRANATVNKFVEQAAKKVQGLEKGAVSPKVDTKQLHDLNKLLDVKQKHIKQVVDFANNNPIKVRVDASEVKAAKAEVAALRGQLSGMSATVKAEIVHKFEHEKATQNEIKREVQLQTKEIRDGNKARKKEKGSAVDKLFSGAINVATSPLKNVMTGFQEGIGQTAARKVAGGAIKSFETQWNFALDKVGESSGLIFAKVGQTAADFTLRAFGTSTKEVNGMFEDLGQSFNQIFDEKEAVRRINNIADALNKVIVKTATMGVVPDAEIKELGKSIHKYRNMGKERREQIRERSINNAVRTASPQSGIVPDVGNQKRVVFYVPGFTGRGGESDQSGNVAGLQSLYGEGTKVIPVQNKSTDVGISQKDNPVGWLTQVVSKISRQNSSSEANADVVRLLSQILEVQRQNPDVQIDIVGHSAGGFVAEQAVAAAKKAGVANVRGVGIATPGAVYTNSGAGNQFQSIISSQDPIHKLAQTAGAVGLGNSGVNMKVVDGINSHALIDYLADTKIQQTLTGGESNVSIDSLINDVVTNEVQAINKKIVKAQTKMEFMDDDSKSELTSSLLKDIKEARRTISEVMSKAEEETQTLLKEIDQFYEKQQRQLNQALGQSVDTAPQGKGNAVQAFTQLGTMAVGAGIGEAVKVGQAAIPVAQTIVQNAVTVAQDVGTGAMKGVGSVIATGLRQRNESIVLDKSVQEAIELAQSMVIDAKGASTVVLPVGGVTGKAGKTGGIYKKAVRDFYGIDTGDVFPTNIPNTDFRKISEDQYPDNPEWINKLPWFLQQRAEQLFYDYVEMYSPQTGLLGPTIRNTVFQGQNKDSVNLAAKMIAARQQNPESQVCAIGHCGGGFVVQEAMAIAESAGADNIYGVGGGTVSVPSIPNVPSGNYSRVLGFEDRFGESIQAMTPLMTHGTTNRTGEMASIEDHQFLSYLAHPDVIDSLAPNLKPKAVGTVFGYQTNLISDSVDDIINSPEPPDFAAIQAIAQEVKHFYSMVDKYGEILEEQYGSELFAQMQSYVSNADEMLQNIPEYSYLSASPLDNIDLTTDISTQTEALGEILNLAIENQIDSQVEAIKQRVQSLAASVDGDNVAPLTAMQSKAEKALGEMKKGKVTKAKPIQTSTPIVAAISTPVATEQNVLLQILTEIKAIHGLLGQRLGSDGITPPLDMPLKMPEQVKESISVENTPSQPAQLKRMQPLDIDFDSVGFEDLGTDLRSLDEAFNNAYTQDAEEAIKEAIEKVDAIREKYKSFGATIRQTLKEGDLKLAKAQIDIAKSSRQFIFDELTKLTQGLEAKGVDTRFGKTGVMGKINQLSGSLTEKGAMAIGVDNSEKALEKAKAKADWMIAPEEVLGVAESIGKGHASEAMQLAEMLGKLEGFDLNAFFTTRGGLNKVGKEIMEGLRQGLVGEDGKLNATMEEIALALPTRVRKLLGIASPSKVFMQIGADVIRGYVLGVNGEIQSIEDLPNLPLPELEAQGWKNLQDYADVINSLSYPEWMKKDMSKLGMTAFEYLAPQGDAVDPLVGQKILGTEKIAGVSFSDVQMREELASSARKDPLGDSTIGENIAEAGEASETAMGKVKNFLSEMIKGNPILNAVSDRFNGLKDTIVKFGFGAASVVGLVMMGKALKDVATNALIAFKNMEGVYVASKMVGGGKQFIKSMSDQVLKLGMDYGSTLKQGMQFAASTIGTPLEAQSQDMFLSLSQSLSYLELPVQQYENALLALQQISSKGVVSMEELRQQLGDAVPGAMGIAADAMDTNVQGLIQMVESGSLLSTEFMPRFVEALANRVEPMAPAAEASLTAAVMRFNAGKDKTMIDIGEQLAPSVIPIINKAADAMILLAENSDKVVWSIQSLAVGLAGLGMGAVASSIATAVKAAGGMAAVMVKVGATIRSLGASIKGVMLVALKPMLIMLAAVAAFEVLSFAIKTTGDKQTTENLEVIRRQLAKLRDEAPVTVDLKGFVETDNGFLNFLDKAARDTDNLLNKLGVLGDLLSALSLPTLIGNLQGKDLLPNFGDVEFSRSMKEVDKILQESAQIFGKSSQVGDPLAMGGYIEQLDDFNKKISTTNARITALRTGDAQANSDKIIQLGEELKTLNKQKSDLIKQFDEVGQNSREVTRDALVAERDKWQGVLNGLDPKQVPEEVALLEQKIAALNKEIDNANFLIDSYDQAMEQLGNTLSRQRLTFINLSAAMAQMNQNFEIGLSEQKASLITGQIERGLQTQVDELENLQFALHEQTEMMRKLQIEFATDKKYLESDAIDPGQRALVEEIIGNKPLTEATMQDVTKLKMRLESEKDGQKSLGESVVNVIENMVNIKTQLAQAGVGIAEANKALAQYDRTQEDYFRDTARQIFDLTIQIEDQQIQDSRSIRDLQFQLEDASVALQRSNRALAESYRDMMLDFDLQIANAQKSLEDNRDQLQLNELRAFNLQISPGNSGSITRQMSDILLRFTEGVFGTKSNERQIKIDILNLEKERIGRLGQIREYEERQRDALRDYNRQVISLTDAFRDMERNIQKSAMGLARSFDEITRAIQRTDASSPAGQELMARLIGARNSYSMPNLSGMGSYGGQLPPPPPGMGGHGQVQANYSYADPRNPTAQELALYGGGQQSHIQQPQQLDYDPIAVRDANKAYMNQPAVGYAQPSNILEQAQFNNMSGRSLTAPISVPAPSYTPQVNPVNFQSNTSTMTGNLVAKAGRAQLTSNQAKSLIATANKIGIDPITLLTIMLFETAGTLSPSITNSIGATGLIQFMPNTAKGLGTSTTALRGMSFEQQMPWVEKYFKSRGFRPGMSDVEAYATVIGGNPRAQRARDSNGVNAVSGLQKMNNSHRGNAMKLLNQLTGNIQSNVGIGGGSGGNAAAGGIATNFGLRDMELGRTAGPIKYLNRLGHAAEFWEQTRDKSQLPAQSNWNDSYDRQRKREIDQLVNGRQSYGDLPSSYLKQFDDYFHSKYGQTNKNTQPIAGQNGGSIPGARAIESGLIKIREATENKGMLDGLMPKPLKQFNNLFNPANRVWTLMDNVQLINNSIRGQDTNPNQLEQWKKNHQRRLDQDEVRDRSRSQPQPMGDWAERQLHDLKKNAPRHQSTGANVNPPAQDFAPATVNPFSPTGNNTSQYIPLINEQFNRPNVGSLGSVNIGQGPTMMDTSPLYAKAGQIDSLNKALILIRQNNNEAEAYVKFLELIDSAAGLRMQAEESNIQGARGLVDSLVSYEQLNRQAKGYLTITEQSQEAGHGMFMQFQNAIRAIEDQEIQQAKVLQGSEKMLMVQAAIVKAIEDAGEDPTAAINDLNRVAFLTEENRLRLSILSSKKQELVVTQNIAAETAQQLKDQELALSMVDAMIQKAGTLAQAEFKAGGRLVDVTAIRQAQFALMTIDARIKQIGRSMNLETPEQWAWLEDVERRTAELNLKASYAEAIPYVKEFGGLLKEVVIEGGNLQEAFSKILKVIAGDIFDKMVLAPVQNWMGETVANLFNLANPESLPDISQGGTNALLYDQVIKGVGGTSGRQSPVQPLPGMDEVAPALNQVTSAAIAVADSGFNPLTANLAQNVAQNAINATTEQAALMTFVGAINAATMALMQFTASMGLNTATSGMGGLFSTFTGGSGGLFGALAGGFTGNTVQLPAFAKGIDDVMNQERMQSGKSPLLAVLHQGEAVLSTLNGDAQLYRALKQSGEWGQFKAKTPQRYALGSDNVGGSGSYNRPMANSSGGVTVVQNWTVQTNDVDGFRRSQKQIDAEAAARYRRSMRN